MAQVGSYCFCTDTDDLCPDYLRIQRHRRMRYLTQNQVLILSLTIFEAGLLHPSGAHHYPTSDRILVEAMTLVKWLVQPIRTLTCSNMNHCKKVPIIAMAFLTLSDHYS